LAGGQCFYLEGFQLRDHLTPGEARDFEALGLRKRGSEEATEANAHEVPTMRIESQIFTHGRFKYRGDFEVVWFDGVEYKLQRRRKAQLCLKFLVDKLAFDVASAQHLITEIDPYVREHGEYGSSHDIRIDHYFNDKTGKLPRLRKQLIHCVARNGRFYLKTS
jgi:hypothetical protein